MLTPILLKLLHRIFTARHCNRPLRSGLLCRVMSMTRIVILGGGFAGLRAAMYFDKDLARRSEIEVTLINRENYTLFTPMLHEVASGDLYAGDIINPIRRILRHGKFVEAEVQSIDLKTLSVLCTG